VLGVIRPPGQLVEYDVPLDLHVVRVAGAVGDDVHEHVHRGVQPLGGNVDVVAGVFAPCVGVEVPAQQIDPFGEFATRGAGGPFEQDVLEEVCGPVLAGTLVRRTGPYPDADCRGVAPGQVLRHHAHAGDRAVHADRRVH